MGRIHTDIAVIDTTAQAARVIGVAPDGTPVVSQIEMETIVIGPMSSDDPPVMILPADAARTRAKLQTDASFLILAPTAATCTIELGWLMVFAYSGLIPEELYTNGEVWAKVFPPDVTPVIGYVRMLVEKRGA